MQIADNTVLFSTYRKDFFSEGFRVTKHLMLVKIDKRLQRDRREKMTLDNGGELLLSSLWIDMARNLQFGIIEQIGFRALEHYPFAEIGDIAVFRHTVEEEPHKLLTTDEEGNEHRVVDCLDDNMNHELYGILKSDGKLIPSPFFLFLDTKCTPLLKEETSTLLNGLNINPMDTQEIKRRIESINEEIAPLIETAKSIVPAHGYLTSQRMSDKLEEIDKQIGRKKSEQQQLTKIMHEDRYAHTPVRYINEDAATELNIQAGERVIVDLRSLYPLEFYGHKFLLMHKNYVLAKYAPQKLITS